MTTGLTGKSTRRPSERVYVDEKVDKLLPHPLNETLYGPLIADEKLVESIKELGVLEPILVARMSFNDGVSYEDYVISGHRRWLAAKQLGLKKIATRDLTAFGGRENRSRNPEAMLYFEKLLIESNRQRVKTESQKDAEVAALLRIEKALAAERQQAGVRQNSAEGGKAVEKVAEITGESPDTVRKRAEIHEAKIPAKKRDTQSTNAAFENLPKPAVCDICQAPFPSKREMKEHRKKAHVAAMEKRRPNNPSLREPVVEPEIPSRVADSTSSLPLHSSKLTETFYVIRRKSDGYFFKVKQDSDCVGEFSPTDDSTGQYVADASRFVEEDTHAIFDLYDERHVDSRKIPRSEWEWVKVQASYTLTAVSTSKAAA